MILDNLIKKKKKKEEDIAPVKETKNTTEKAPIKSTIGKIANRFSDGYQIGDISKSILDVKDSVMNIRDEISPVKRVENKAREIGTNLVTGVREGTLLKGNKGTQELKDIWSDGFQPSDIGKTKEKLNQIALGTGVDTLANLTKGELQTAEGLVDAGRYLTSDAFNLVGKKDTAEAIRNRAIQNTTGYILGENDMYNNPKQGWSKKVDDYSLFGDSLDQISQSVGQQAFRIGLQNAMGSAGASEGTMRGLNQLEIFAGSYGSAKSEALASGADNKTATIRGFISGTAEWISENMFDAIPEFKTGGIQATNLKNTMAEAAEKALGKNAGKYIIRGINSAEEGIEEGVSNGLETAFTDIMNYLVDDYNYGMQEGQGLDKNKSAIQNLKKLLKDTLGSATSKESGKAFLTAMFSTLITAGMSSGMTESQRKQVINGYAKDNNISTEKATELFDTIRDLRLEQRIDENTGYEQKMEMTDQATRQLAQEYIAGNRNGQKLDLYELYKQTPKSRKEAQFTFTDDEAKAVKTDRQKTLANDLARINNEKSVHQLYKTINAIQSANDTQQYHITTTEGLYEMGIVNKDANGNYVMPDGSPYVPRGLNYKNGEIYINADVGSQSGTQAVYHEMLEGFKKASPEQYNQFKQMVTDIIGEKNIQKEFDTYKAMYGEELTDDIRDEIINDKFGELAENQNFINKIADNRNVLEKIIDSIKNMIKYVKGTDEERQLMKLQKNLEKEFAKRYKETDFSQGEGDTAYSIQGLEDYSRDDIKNITRDYIEQTLLDSDIDAQIKGLEIIGSRNRGNARADSDLDIVVELDGNDLREDDLFNALNDEHLEIDGIQVDINPILASESGTLENYLERSKQYDKEVLNKTNSLKKQLENQAEKAIKEDIANYDSIRENILDYIADNNLTNPSVEEMMNAMDDYNMLDYSDYDLQDYREAEKLYRQVAQDIYNENNTTYSLTSNKDSQGRELSKQQQEYFKDSKVVDENGNLLEVYHGSVSNEQINIFDTNAKPVRTRTGVQGTYFTSNGREAQNYRRIPNADRKSKGTFYKVYLKITNPLDITDDIKLYQKKGLTFNEAKQKALEKLSPDNDGVIFRGDTINSDEFIVFNSNQIKSVDNTNPTDNPDIRFSLTPLNELDPKKEYYFRGQTNNEQKIAYNNTHFQGNTEGGVFVTPDRTTAEKYGNNVLAMEKTKDNTVSVAESDKLMEWASKIVQDDINNQRESDYVIEQMALARPRAFAEYTGKPFVETGDMFGEPGEAIYYQEVADGTSTYRDNYSLTSNQNIDSKEIAPVGSTVEDTIAPIREDISNLTDKIDNLSTQLETMQNGAETPVRNDIAPSRALNNTEIAPEEAYKDENYWKSLEEFAETNTGELDKKVAKKLSKNMAKQLGLKQKQLGDLQNIIEDAFNNGKSVQEIKNDLDLQFGHDSVVEKNDEAIEAQKLIRQFPINVSPNIQKNIADYGYWKQFYFGKIKFSKDGDSVDSVYQQLNALNPAMFPGDIWNETDQLLKIAEVADMDRKYTVDYELPQQTIDEAANYIHDTFMETMYANAIKSANDLEESALQYNEYLKELPAKKKTRQEVREFLQNGMGITTDDLQAGNDISSMSYNLTTPERVNEKVFGREIGRKINNETVYFAKHQEAERTRFLNKERQEIKDLGIKARSKESELVQKYGEGLIDDIELANEIQDKETQDKIKNAAKVLRSKYDTYLDMINEELVDMGYDPIPKRKDYMRHFQELTDKFSMAGIPFNRQDMNAENLPTDINGLTEFNAPGKNWFASALKRKGEKTTYDAITGIDGYLEGASNLMYHTETIQRYRTLEKLIRDTYGQTHGLEEFGDDLSTEDAMQRIQDIEEGKLSNYAAWIHEQGNAIAGKKGALDRGVERALGRKAYTLANTLKKQTGSNMTGFNVRSAMTNFISSTIAASKTNKLAMVKGTVDTIKNIFNDDGFINRSDFLTSRFGSDSISQKVWDKISNAGQIFMRGSDWFTSNLIVRSKYYEGLQNGMTEDEAMNYANDFGARVMGDRSKGATAEAFNSKTLGILTQFQLETNNQWQYMIHDTKMEYQKNLAEKGGLKAGATVLFQMGQLAAYSYLFNEMFEKLTGSRAAFDIADIIKKLFGLDDDDKDKTFEERMKEAGSELVDALPFASLFGSGGRLPIGEMLTPAQTVYDYITGGTNKYGQEITLKDVGKDLRETLPYYVLPTGYGQLKKTKQGLEMYSDELPVAGSYTDSGNLRFTADEDTGSMIKNALFGKWADTEAKKYRESGYKTIRKEDIQEMKDLGMKSSEYRDYKTGLKEAGTKNADKIDYINSLDIPINQKNIMAENVLDKDIDMSDYNKYGSYAEFDYAYKNPEQYLTISQITDYDTYNQYKNDIQQIRSSYSTTNERKAAVQQYIEGLDLNKYQKIMLQKMAGGYSIKSYKSSLQRYIDSLDLTASEKQQIDNMLFK